MDEQLSLDELNRRLAEIQELLLDIDPRDFAARYELKVEQDRLRRLTRRYAKERDLDRTSEDLMSELRARESALDQIREKMVSAAAQAGGGGGGSGSFEGPLDAFKINNSLLKGTEADKLMQRIARLQTILRERGEL